VDQPVSFEGLNGGGLDLLVVWLDALSDGSDEGFALGGGEGLERLGGIGVVLLDR